MVFFRSLSVSFVLAEICWIFTCCPQFFFIGNVARGLFALLQFVGSKIHDYGQDFHSYHVRKRKAADTT